MEMANTRARTRYLADQDDYETKYLKNLEQVVKTKSYYDFTPGYRDWLREFLDQTLGLPDDVIYLVMAYVEDRDVDDEERRHGARTMDTIQKDAYRNILFDSKFDLAILFDQWGVKLANTDPNTTIKFLKNRPEDTLAGLVTTDDVLLSEKEKKRHDSRLIWAFMTGIRHSKNRMYLTVKRLLRVGVDKLAIVDALAFTLPVSCTITTTQHDNRIGYADYSFDVIHSKQSNRLYIGIGKKNAATWDSGWYTASMPIDHLLRIRGCRSSHPRDQLIFEKVYSVQQQLYNADMCNGWFAFNSDASCVYNIGTRCVNVIDQSAHETRALSTTWMRGSMCQGESRETFAGIRMNEDLQLCLCVSTIHRIMPGASRWTSDTQEYPISFTGQIQSLGYMLRIVTVSRRRVVVIGASPPRLNSIVLLVLNII